MSSELFPSSQGKRRTVLIFTGSNKRDHLLGYFIISLFICMWSLQKASNMPPEADGWRGAAMPACSLGRGPASAPAFSTPWVVPLAALVADVICTHHSLQKLGWDPKGQQVGWEISNVGIARGREGGNEFSWQLAACSLQRWKELGSVNNCSHQSKSHLAPCLDDIFLPVRENRVEFSGCVWRWLFQRFCKRISYTFQLSVLEKELVRKREIQRFLWDFEECYGELDISQSKNGPHVYQIIDIFKRAIVLWSTIGK